MKSTTARPFVRNFSQSSSDAGKHAEDAAPGAAEEEHDDAEQEEEEQLEQPGLVVRVGFHWRRSVTHIAKAPNKADEEADPEVEEREEEDDDDDDKGEDMMEGDGDYHYDDDDKRRRRFETALIKSMKA